MIHPLVEQLRFARSEFERGLVPVADPEAQKRFGSLNCISWIVGHLAWQEQRYWLHRAQGKILLPMLDELLAYGKPASTPPASEMWEAWRQVTQAADEWLETASSERLQAPLLEGFSSAGTFLLRNTYHYWYHLGEGMAVRQMLGQTGLPDFVGDIDTLAPYRSETGEPPNQAVRKEQFIAQVRAAHFRWEALLAQISPERLLEPGVSGSWSLKDIVAHLTWHEREMLEMLQRRNVDGSDWWLMPTDQRNQAIYEQYQEAPVDQLLSEAQQVRQAMIQELDRLEEEALHDPGRYGNMPADWRPWEILAGNTYQHYMEHLLGVQEWLQEHPAP